MEARDPEAPGADLDQREVGDAVVVLLGGSEGAQSKGGVCEKEDAMGARVVWRCCGEVVSKSVVELGREQGQSWQLAPFVIKG